MPQQPKYPAPSMAEKKESFSCTKWTKEKDKGLNHRFDYKIEF